MAEKVTRINRRLIKNPKSKVLKKLRRRGPGHERYKGGQNQKASHLQSGGKRQKWDEKRRSSVVKRPVWYTIAVIIQ